MKQKRIILPPEERSLPPAKAVVADGDGNVFAKQLTLWDRAGYKYTLALTPTGDSYVAFEEDGTPLVVRNGEKVPITFFTDGEGRWAKLINSTNPEKVEKVLKKKENPAIAMKDGEIIVQLIPLSGIKWEDEKGHVFFLASHSEHKELMFDHLPHVSAYSEGTYESLVYYATTGLEDVPVPQRLKNENGIWFTVGGSIKSMAYDVMRKHGHAVIAVKNGQRLVYARPSDEGEFIMAHTFGAYEAGERGTGKGWIVDYVEGGNGGWEVPTAEEFFRRYEFVGPSEDGRAMFIGTEAKYVWCHLTGNMIFCIPQWGDSMVAMSNPIVNITNPDDVYACSYIEFYGKEDVPGGYIVLKELFLGAPEFAILEFAGTFKGYLETTFGIPKSAITASNLVEYLQSTLGVPDVAGVQEKIAAEVVA